MGRRAVALYIDTPQIFSCPLTTCNAYDMSTSSPSSAITVIFLVFLFALVWLLRFGKRESYLPPGPPTLPLLGNIHVLPTRYPHDKFTEWSRQYGGIYSLKIGTGTIIVLSNMTTVKELLDKRNAATASRPKNHVVDVVTRGLYFGLIPNNSLWRAQRKLYAETAQVLYDILKSPQDLCDHFSRYAFSLTTSILYGKRCPRPRSSEITAFYEFQFVWTKLLSPGTVPPVDKLPFLDYIPERWASWKALIREVKERHRKLYFGLLDDCENQMKSDVGGNGSFMEDLLGRKEEYGMDREEIGYLGAMMIEGGAETTSSLLKSLVLFLVASPEAQRKAYEEIRRVVGSQRAPDLADFEHLPYIDAVLKEVQRLRPIAPLGLPHETTTTEEYLGYIIPEKTTIFANIYGINTDPEFFEDPESFRPERYLLTEHGTKPGVDDSAFRSDIGFGFGRALNAMNLIWAFEFKPLQDPETGKDVPVDLLDYEEGLVFAPRPYQCHVTPRSSNVVDIIQHQFREAKETFAKYERDLTPEDKEWVREMRKDW
ncbi:cytochrome [Moniliophthora roreri]|nr:cytochrome [Moniliophthora roreri]